MRRQKRIREGCRFCLCSIVDILDSGFPGKGVPAGMVAYRPKISRKAVASGEPASTVYSSMFWQGWELMPAASTPLVVMAADRLLSECA